MEVSAAVKNPVQFIRDALNPSEPAPEMEGPLLPPNCHGLLPMGADVPGVALSSIGARGALLSADFVACETVKVRAVRSLPVHVLRREDTGRFPADDHPFARIVHRPNALMTWGDLMAWAWIRRDVMGTAYIRVIRDRSGRPYEARPVLAHVDRRFDPETGRCLYFAPADEWNEPWECREDGVVVLRTDVIEDGMRGRSLAEMAAEELGLDVDLTAFYRSLLENGNHFQGWAETDERLQPEDVDAIRYSLDDSKGPGGAGGIRVFDRGLKYHQVSVQLEGMSLVEQERWVLERVCRACHVDLHHVYGDNARTTATSAAGADLDFVKATVLPEVTAFEQAVQPVLDGAASLGGRDSGYRLKFNLNGLLRGDFQTRMEGYRIGVYAGIFTRAYCAAQEDVPWLPGQDRLLQPTAYYMLDDAGVPYLPAAPTDGTEGQSDGVSGIDERNVADRLRPVIADARDRISKRAARDGDTDGTRAFASMVLAPVAQCAAMAGEFLPVDEIADEAIKEAAHA